MPLPLALIPTLITVAQTAVPVAMTTAQAVGAASGFTFFGYACTRTYDYLRGSPGSQPNGEPTTPINEAEQMLNNHQAQRAQARAGTIQRINEIVEETHAAGQVAQDNLSETTVLLRSAAAGLDENQRMMNELIQQLTTMPEPQRVIVQRLIMQVTLLSQKIMQLQNTAMQSIQKGGIALQAIEAAARQLLIENAQLNEENKQLIEMLETHTPQTHTRSFPN